MEDLEVIKRYFGGAVVFQIAVWARAMDHFSQLLHHELLHLMYLARGPLTLPEQLLLSFLVQLMLDQDTVSRWKARTRAATPPEYRY